MWEQHTMLIFHLWKMCGNSANVWKFSNCVFCSFLCVSLGLLLRNIGWNNTSGICLSNPSFIHENQHMLKYQQSCRHMFHKDYDMLVAFYKDKLYGKVFVLVWWNLLSRMVFAANIASLTLTMATITSTIDLLTRMCIIPADMSWTTNNYHYSALLLLHLL